MPRVRPLGKPKERSLLAQRCLKIASGRKRSTNTPRVRAAAEQLRLAALADNPGRMKRWAEELADRLQWHNRRKEREVARRREFSSGSPEFVGRVRRYFRHSGKTMKDVAQDMGVGVSLVKKCLMPPDAFSHPGDAPYGSGPDGGYLTVAEYKRLVSKARSRVQVKAQRRWRGQRAQKARGSIKSPDHDETL